MLTCVLVLPLNHNCKKLIYLFSINIIQSVHILEIFLIITNKKIDSINSYKQDNLPNDIHCINAHVLPIYFSNVTSFIIT